MRKIIVAGNWKMYKTVSDTKKFFDEFHPESSDVTIIICPSFVSLGSGKLPGNIKLGAQNLHYEEEGAYTGEVSAKMLADVGCEYVIIGHSERRDYFGEHNDMVNKKIKAALGANLKPIVCVGETDEERNNEDTNDVISDEIEGAFNELTEENMKNIVVAYEPIWAIGTGKVATPEQAEEVHSFIRNKIAELFGENIASGVSILYGGSVKPENSKLLFQKENIDGALVGGASLDPKRFTEIIASAKIEKRL